MEKLLEMWNAFSKEKKAITIAAGVLALALVVGGGVLIAGHLRDKNGNAGTEGTMDTAVTEVFGTEEVFMTEMTEETEMEVIQTISVRLSASSIEKDLKIKILDENDVRVKGQNFVITVTPEGASEGTEYNDHDMDGIIYMKKMTPGKYTVQLHDIEGYVPVENPITATVKDQIAYEKVDISNEIKDVNEVSTPEVKPDNGESTKNEIKDTLPYLKSDVDREIVSKENVDISAFADAIISVENVEKTLVEKEGKTTTASLPKSATLYTAGKESSKTVTLQLNLKDDAGVVREVKWLVDGVAAGSSKVVDCKAVDGTTATFEAKAVGNAIISVEITYIATETTTSPSETPGDSSEQEGVQSLAEGSPFVNSRTGANTDTSVQPQVTEKTEVISCEISVENQSDDTTHLKDKNGNLLYLDEQGTVPATPSNYASVEQFYTMPKYTGWQKIGEKTYYYKEDHTYATGTQIIGGVEYEFDETGYLITKERSLGIDVSKWQGKIDWEAVANDPAGIDFAIIRCGNRYGKSGEIVEDPYFKQNIEGAIKNGIKVGVYFFSQATTKAEAVEEASAALELVKGYDLQLPIYIDTESLEGGRANALSKEERTEILKTFCEVVKNAGYKPGVYSGAYWYRTHVIASEIEQYHIWVAQYNDELSYKGRYDIWQYTSSGSVAGINGRVDMNIAYRVYH